MVQRNKTILKSRQKFPKAQVNWNFGNASKLQPGAGPNLVGGWTGENLKAGVTTIDLAQADSLSQPTFNVDHITFDGDDYLTETSGLIISDGSTIVFKMKSVASPVSFARIISTKLAFDDLTGFEITITLTSSDSITVLGSSGTFNSVMVDDFVAGEPVIAVVFSGNNAAIYSNGVFKGNAPIDQLVTNVNPLVVGARNSGSDPFEGNIYKILAYPTVLDASEIVAISASLA